MYIHSRTLPYSSFSFQYLSRPIHYFRLGLSTERTQPRTPGLLKGQLGDAFFEPLPEEELLQWE